MLPVRDHPDVASAPCSTVTTPYSSSVILSDWPTLFREDGIHPSAGVVGAGAGGGATDGAAAAGADGTAPMEARGGIGARPRRAPGGRPGSPPGRRGVFRRSRRRDAQLRDDVVFGRRRREERSRAPAGRKVGHRGIDAVSLPELGDRSLEQEGVLRLPGRLLGGLAPAGKQHDVGAGQRHQARGQQAGQDGNRCADVLFRLGRERGDGDAAGKAGRGYRGGTPGRRRGGGWRQGRRAPRVDRECCIRRNLTEGAFRVKRNTVPAGPGTVRGLRQMEGKAAANFSWIPPNPPFDMTRTRSPARHVSARRETIPSTSGMTCAGRPAARSSAATSSGASRSCGGIVSAPNTSREDRLVRLGKGRGELPLEHLPSLGFDRGSKTATIRRPGYRPRIARTVSRTAVGWCAKSSTTRIPLNSPTPSCRRRIPANRSNVRAIAAGRNPRRIRTIATPAALAALCSPGRGKRKSRARRLPLHAETGHPAGLSGSPHRPRVHPVPAGSAPSRVA